MASASLRRGRLLALTHSSLLFRIQPMVPQAFALAARSFASSRNVEKQVKQVVAAEVQAKSSEVSEPFVKVLPFKS